MGKPICPRPVLVLALLLHVCPAVAMADEIWQVREGTLTLYADEALLAEFGLAIDSSFSLDPEGHGRPRYGLEFSQDDLVAVGVSGTALPATELLRLSQGVLLDAPDGGLTVVDLEFDAQDRWDDGTHHRVSESPALVIAGVKSYVEREGETGEWHLYGAEVTANAALADALGIPLPSGSSLGQVQISATVQWIGGDEPLATEDGGQSPIGSSAAGSQGPDMTFCQLYGLSQFGREGSVVGLAVATTSWNIGTEPLLWFQNPDERHPFIIGNLYRSEDDRFEQIGQSWIKHGFCALDSSQCATSCQGTGCTTLGLGCTDTYGASLNANRSYLGPRHEVNPWTGDFTYPGSHLATSHSHDAIEHRLQVDDSDLNQAVHGNANYFAEGYYVCLDDVNVMNSISHKPVTVSGSPGGTWSFGMSGSGTSPITGPAIFAWSGATFTTLAQQLPVQEFVSPDGRCVLGAKVTDLGNGTHHYEYALYNVDMDRKVGSFSIPVTPGTLVTNVGFHSVSSHNEPFANTPWSWSIANGAIIWDTNDNPVRWGTLYNFRFDANVGPITDTTVTLGMYDPGTPTTVTGLTLGPALGPPDCDDDGVTDACELDCGAGGCPLPPACGGSIDCNSNLVPDECEVDCNSNQVPDDCDITAGTSDDCDGNGVPDECDADSDSDGVPDACDACPGFDDAMDEDGDGTPDGCDACPASGDKEVENEHFDSDPSWTIVDDAGLTDGTWTWGVPAGGGDRWDPPTDADGTGACYVTDNLDGNSDVDGGATRLLSPVYDLTAGEAMLSYSYWIGTSATGTDDTLVAELSNNGGGSWSNIATYDTNVEAWQSETVQLSTILPLTSQMRIRFSASDADPQSVLECGVDAVEILICLESCTVDADCDDSDPCTDDTCSTGQCINDPVDCSGLDDECLVGTCNPGTGVCEAIPVAMGTSCDDGHGCTENDTCNASGQCQGSDIDCSSLDGPCTAGVCNPGTGSCEPDHFPPGTNCNDDDLCTVGDACDGTGTCAGSDRDCSEFDSQCTAGVCDPATGMCEEEFANQGEACDDGDACTEGEVCADGECVGGPVSCDDRNVCTDDSCDPATGCMNIDNTTACEDGLFCNGSEVCSGGTCQAGIDPCPGEICDESNDSCVECLINADCDDGVFCNGSESCVDGVCQAGSDPCTDQLCHEASGSCVDCILDADCDDGVFCNGAEACTGDVCQAGSDPCPTQACDEASDSCVACLGNADCDDSNICTDNVCSDGTCTYPNNNAACDDGLQCTENDTCSFGACAGSPIPDCGKCDVDADCDDGNPCTDDACPAGICVHDYNTIPCDDGDFCTADDTCVQGICTAGAPLDCEDGNECTDDACLAGTGCVNSANAAPCDDGDACTTDDICSLGSCTGGPPEDCNDDNPCTDDSCDADSGCLHVNNNASCDDGDPCTVNDTCSGGTCVGGEPNVCVPPSAPIADGIPKNRYVSFIAGSGSGGEAIVQALRVQCVGHPGYLKWVGEPDIDGLARLECAPVYREWGSQYVHVGDTDIGPQLTFVIQGIRDTADVSDESAYSDSAAISTVDVWGDITGGFDDNDGWLPPNGTTNFGDIQATVLAFQNMNPPPMIWADVGDAQPNHVVNLGDVQLVVQGFQQFPYPFGEPQHCE